MTRLMTFVLSAGPYSGQTAASVLKLAGVDVFDKRLELWSEKSEASATVAPAVW